MSTPDTSAGSAAAEASADAAIDYGDMRPPSNWPKWRRRLKRVAAIITPLIVVLVALCLWFRVYSPRDLTIYMGMSSCSPPIWRAIVMRRYGVGDSAEELVKEYPPDRVEAIGDFVWYHYRGIEGTGNILVVAEDGRLIYAGLNDPAWEKTFFVTDKTKLFAAARNLNRFKHAKWQAIKAAAHVASFGIVSTSLGDAAATVAAMDAGGSAEPEPNDPESAATQAQDAGAAQSAIRLVPLSEERLALLKGATVADDGRIIRSTNEAEIVLAPDGTEVARIALNGRRLVYHQGLPVALSGSGTLTMLDAAFRETITFATVDRAYCRTFDGRTFVKFGPAELLPGYQAPDYGFAVYDATGKLLLERGAESGLEFVGETSSAVLVRQADPERKSDEAFQVLRFDGREPLAFSMPSQEVSFSRYKWSADGRYFTVSSIRFQHPKSGTRVFRADGTRVMDHAGDGVPHFAGDLLVFVDFMDRASGQVKLQPVRLSETREPDMLPRITVESGPPRSMIWEFALCHGGAWMLMLEHSGEVVDGKPRSYLRNVVYDLATGKELWSTPHMPFFGSNNRKFGQPSPWTKHAILTYDAQGNPAELRVSAP